jgi:hypothetical protein
MNPSKQFSRKKRISFLPSVSNMFDAQPVIGVLLVFGGLNVDPAFGHSHTLGLGVLNDRGTPAFSLHVSLKNNF